MDSPHRVSPTQQKSFGNCFLTTMLSLPTSLSAPLRLFNCCCVLPESIGLMTHNRSRYIYGCHVLLLLKTQMKMLSNLSMAIGGVRPPR